jgi:hypothetical protein
MSACNGKEHTAYMTETLAVFQPPMFWLKADAQVIICEPHGWYDAMSAEPARYAPKHASQDQT